MTGVVALAGGATPAIVRAMLGRGWRLLVLSAGIVVARIVVGQLAEPPGALQNLRRPPAGFAEKKIEPHQVRVPCEEVMSAVNRSARLKSGATADLSDIAANLGTTPLWVERCMLTYGRRPKRPGHESAEAIEARLEHLEEDEPEETASEDTEEPGASEIKQLPEKQRIEKPEVKPTPDPITDMLAFPP